MRTRPAGLPPPDARVACAAALANGSGFSGQSAVLKTPPIARNRPFTPPLSRHSRTLAGPHPTDLPNSPGFGLESQAQHQAGVAQLVEQRIRNAKVGSSTLFPGTRFLKRPPLRWPFWSELLKKRNSTNKYHVYIQNHQHIAIINKNQCCDYFHKKQSSIF